VCLMYALATVEASTETRFGSVRYSTGHLAVQPSVSEAASWSKNVAIMLISQLSRSEFSSEITRFMN